MFESTSDEAIFSWIARRSNDGVFLVIAEARTDAPLEFVQLTDIYRRNGTCVTGIALLEEACVKGFG